MMVIGENRLALVWQEQSHLMHYLAELALLEVQMLQYTSRPQIRAVHMTSAWDMGPWDDQLVQALAYCGSCCAFEWPP